MFRNPYIIENTKYVPFVVAFTIAGNPNFRIVGANTKAEPITREELDIPAMNETIVRILIILLVIFGASRVN